MTEQGHQKRIKPSTAARVLEILNSARAPSEIEKSVGGKDNAAAILELRSRIGGFDTLSDLEHHTPETRSGLKQLVANIEKPKFDFGDTSGNYVMWSQSSAFEIEESSVFRATHRGHGVEILGYSREEVTAAAKEGRRLGYSIGWIHAPIPTPSSISGSPVFLRSIFLNYSGSEPSHGFQGAPLAAITEMKVFDGHRLVFDENLDYTPETNTHRYRRIRMDHDKRIEFGVSVSLLVHVASLGNFHLTISAAGAEFVPREGPVVALS